jgi:ParB family chromosome partitioning protein
VLHEAAAAYKIDTEATAVRVKQEFAAKGKMQAANKSVAKA